MLSKGVSHRKDFLRESGESCIVNRDRDTCILFSDEVLQNAKFLKRCCYRLFSEWGKGNSRNFIIISGMLMEWPLETYKIVCLLWET